MVLRNIVKIDEEKCTGCGQCVNACAEGAIEIINGKAKLVSDIYCDGLGACLGKCPEDAITVEQREAPEFDEKATKQHLAKMQKANTTNFVCPGVMDKKLREKSGEDNSTAAKSHLTHWPVQLKLVSPKAPCFQNADLLLVADCVPFAMGDFHNRFLKDHSIVVGCPKLDDPQFYIEKLAQILKANKLNSLAVVHMEVPCCFGLTEIAKKAIALAKADLSFKDVTVALDGTVTKTDIVKT
jgi:Pyruvate/2-oxoacid:ferredoxin oxidoreductase delta subunit